MGSDLTFKYGDLEAFYPGYFKKEIKDAIGSVEVKEYDSRKDTNRILEMVDDGILDAADVVMMCLKYMSEDEVADMARANDLFPEEDEE